MTLPVYFTGTVNVTHGGTTVTGTGCMWSGINAKQGDYFTRLDGTAVITEVTDTATLQITPWPGATVTGGDYAIQQNYVGRVVGVAAAEDVGVMLEKLHTDGLPFIVGADETVPDPSYGDEGQLAFKPSTGEWWVKQGGAWVHSTGLTALGYGGTSATSILIATGPASFTTQGSLAYNGARVRAASAANINNWMEGVAAYSGTTLNMTADKIGGSGTHADWLFSIAGQPGTNGIGAGDMLAANNLSELTATAATARKNIYAAPFDALAYNGIQVNGNAEVSQENGATAVYGGAGGTTVNKYVADGWRIYSTGAQSISWAGGNGGIVGAGIPAPPAGYQGLAGVWLNVANASPAAGDFLFFQHLIEGYRISRLAWGTANAQPLSVGFWFYTPLAGTYSMTVRNGPATRSYAATFACAASTWEWKTFTIPGDTAGAWNTDNTIGLSVNITAMSSATYLTSTANAWVAGNFLGVTGTINAAAGGNKFAATGLIVLPGIELPSAARAPFIMRPFDQELVTCKRYFYKGDGDPIGIASSTYFAGGPLQYSMRVAPVAAATFGVNSGPVGSFAVVLLGATKNSCGFYNGAGNWTANAQVYFATLSLDARL